MSALALVGCSSAAVTPESCGRVANTSPTLLSAFEVSDQVGTPPTASFPKPFVAASPEHMDVVTGSGAVIESLDQAVYFDLTLFDGVTGVAVPFTGYTDEDWRVSNLGALIAEVPGLEDAFLCASEGSRVVAALGAEGGSEALSMSAMQATGQLIDPAHTIAVVDINRVLPASADGSPVYNAGHGMPSVIRTPAGVPGVTVPRGAAPSETRTQTLLKGDGDELGADEVFIGQILTVQWDTGRVVSSTWADEALQVSPVENLPEDVRGAVIGATAGSQVMTVVPDADHGALVYVIDILGTSDMPAM